MSDALDRLEALVRETEKSFSRERMLRELQDLGRAVSEAAEQNREAQEALAALRRDRPRFLEGIGRDEERLEALVEKIRALEEAGATVEELREVAGAADQDLEARRREGDEALREAESRAGSAVRALQEASTAYRRAREGTVRLHPAEAAAIAAPEAAQRATFNQADLSELEGEVERTLPHFGTLAREEQYAQMRVWIGRLRRVQSFPLSEEDDRRARRLFVRLVGISKDYEPGYIEAFRQEYKTEWNEYVEEGERALRRAADSRVARAAEAGAGEREQKARLEREARVREVREGVRGLVTREPFELDALVDFVREGSTAAWSDSEVLDMIAPWSEAFSGSEFRSLRRNLQKLEDARSEDAPPAIDPEILAATSGTLAVLVGGEPREAARRSIETALRFAQLEWVPNSDAVAIRIEERVANRSIDWVLVLRSFVSHGVYGRLADASKRSGVPFLLVEQGYGAARIAETFRERLGRQTARGG